MISKNTIYLAAATLSIFLICFTTASLWSSHKVTKMERVVADAKDHAETLERDAATQEQKAAEYKAKIEYMETQLAEISATARRQDEELQMLENNTNTARDNVARARRVRSVTATADQLCTKLEELGHPCE